VSERIPRRLRLQNVDPGSLGGKLPSTEKSMYRATTRAVQVTVEANYLEEESSPGEGRFFWAYTIEIVNLGTRAVQLRSRYWRITDASGRVEEVRGLGVVGKQPKIEPGESFQYTSGCPLPTPSGIMVGTYQMESEDGDMFVVEIPAFSLDLPNTKRVLN
jgi:ApaG protein